MAPSTTPPAEPSPETYTSPLVTRTYGEPRFHNDGDVAALAFQADGTLWSIDETGVLRHWDTAGKQLSRAFLSDLETLWAFSPNAKLLASGNDDLLFWEVESGQLAKRIEQPAWVTGLAFSADGQTLASGHDDGTVRFWDAATHKFVGAIAPHEQPISAIAFSPDGEHVATAAEDRVVRVWDGFSHKQVTELLSHTDRIPALAWSPDGSLLISAGWDTSARVWKLDQPDPVILLNSHADQVMTLGFAPTGGLLAVADSDNDIYLWTNAETATVGPVLRGHVDEIRCLAFSPDGTRLASAGVDRVVHLWDVGTGQLLAGPNPKGRNVVTTGVTKGVEWIASTGAPTFRLWNAATGAELSPSNDGPAFSVANTPDGRWLAIGGTDYFTRLYDLHAPGSEPKRLEATKPPIGGVAFHPKGEMLAQTSPADGLVWLWNTETAEPIVILIEAADGSTLESIAFHPDGTRLAVGGIDYLSTSERDGAVCLWDVHAKEKTATFDSGVYAVAFDPSGRFLAGAGITDRVYLWDLTTNELVFELEGHQERINAVAFDPTGSYVVSASDDLTLRVWDVLSGRLLVVRGFDSPVQSVAFNAKGDVLYTGNADTTCHQIPFTKLLED